nr:hypothetical protein [Tanacetum cinerariifolium]
MKYVPASVSKLENGNRRISFSTEESEEGMKKVLESGPWMIQNVPLVLNIWEPGIWLTKTEPSSIPIWVYVYNIPLELCNGNGIGKIMSGVGKPLLMDKMTREQCLKKASKMDFARVLVEVSAEDDLPNVIEIEYPPLGNRPLCIEDDLPNVIEIKYPPLGNRPLRIGMLEVKYQWRPPLCTHYKIFGHSTLSCKFRPRTDDEIATNIVKEAINVNGSRVTVSSSNLNDGFVFVGNKNKPVITQNRSAPVNYNKSNFYGMRGKGVDNGRRQLAGNQKQYGNGQVFNDSGNFRRNIQGNNASNRQMSKNIMGLKNSSGNSKHNNRVEWQKKNSKSNTGNGFAQGNVGKKPLYQYRNDPNFKPKVLVRGFGSNNNVNRVSDETINIKNSFNVLRDVESDVEGIAMDMKPEFDVNAVNESEINTTTCDDVSNGV